MKWILMIFALSVVGCSKENKPCPESKECGEGLKCVELTNMCRARCVKNSECGEGLICGTKVNICIDPIIIKKIDEDKRKERKIRARERNRGKQEQFDLQKVRKKKEFVKNLIKKLKEEDLEPDHKRLEMRSLTNDLQMIEDQEKILERKIRVIQLSKAKKEKRNH